MKPTNMTDQNFRELFVDNFAGGGGASTGIEMALGRPVDHAINHDREALGMHRINHPLTIHHREDVFDVDPAKLTEGRPVGGGWFSPDCKHFSKAKGGKPLSKKIRGLAFVILRWAAIRTRVIYMENVEEIQTWGPLLENGKPDPAHKGRTWHAFLAALGNGVDPSHPDIPEMLEVLGDSITREQLITGFGYAVETREIRACDFGAPTIRNRLFLVARCDGLPVVWPDPTHADPRLGREKHFKPWRTIAECIDWSIPCNSIFLTRKQAKAARCRRPLAKSTLRRIAIGVYRYVLQAEEPFLVSLTHQGGDRIEPINEPARVVTGAHRGEKALVDAQLAPFITEHANASNQRSMPADEPLRTQCAEVKGGHFSLVAASLAREFGESVGQSLPQPAPTVMPGGGGKTSLISSHLARFNGSHKGRNDGDGRGQPTSTPITTQDTSNRHALVSAHLTKFNTGSVGADLRNPSPVIAAGSHSPETHGGAASTLGLVAANMVKFRGNVETHPPAKPMNAPVDTISACAEHHGVVAASLAAYYGSERDGQAVDQSLRTLSTKPRFGLTLSEAVAPPMTEAQFIGAHRVAKFLRRHGVKFEGEFATVGGFVIVDIGMRMLVARELFRAQGFSDEYIIDRAWVIDPKTGENVEVMLTKEQQIRMCGNSVCPPVAAALVAANSPDMVISSPFAPLRLCAFALKKGMPTNAQ
jgi:DNA (cytosine-5)-methyltransferase 1